MPINSSIKSETTKTKKTIEQSKEVKAESKMKKSALPPEQFVSATDKLKEVQVFTSVKKYLSDNGLTGYTDEQLAEVVFENGKLADWIKTNSKGEITNHNDILIRLMKKFGYPK
ncbi:MAG: hypothetical protein LBN20_01930 [Endomicrobium sp.]|jgi:hypothetical protein|nr:hypothetical protein [Endomicrobium sp.]